MAETDDRLKALERQIKSTYTKAYREMKEEATKLLTKMQSNPDMPMAQKIALMNKYNRLDTLTQQMADTVANANSVAEKMMNNEMVNIYEINYNGDAERLGFSLVDHNAIKKILKEEENPFTKINALHDKTAIKNKMKGELMTGLLKGESMQKIATRFKNVSEGYLKNAIRVARTETTRVQNSAKMDVGKHGEELGFIMMKRWVATTDHRVRDDHLAMNGVEVEQDQPFVLPDGSKMMFPADISLGADAGQVINCRCTVVEFIKRDENGNLVMKGDVEEKLKSNEEIKQQIDKMKPANSLMERMGGVENPYEYIGNDLNKELTQVIRDIDDKASNEGIIDILGNPKYTHKEQLSVSSLVTSQSGVYKKNLENMLEKELFNVEGSDIIAVKYKGQYIIQDGNHRATLQKLRGDKKIEVRVFDIDKYQEGGFKAIKNNK